MKTTKKKIMRKKHNEKWWLVDIEALNDSIIRTENPHNQLVQRRKTDLGGTIGKIPSERLIRPARKVAKLVTKTSSKVQEPKTYNETINNLVHGNRWQTTINEELWNLDSHLTWTYIAQSSDWKAINYKL